MTGTDRRSRFGVISSVDVAAEASWRDRLFLTFDIDGACDAVLADTMALVADAGVAAT